MKKNLLIIALLVLIPACGTEKKPSPLDDALGAEYNAEDTDSAERRPAIRKAVDDYLRQHIPDWQVKGVALSFYDKNTYLIGADVSRGKENQTVYLMARLFVGGQGESYWKVEDVTPQKLEFATGRVLRENSSSE